LSVAAFNDALAVITHLAITCFLAISDELTCAATEERWRLLTTKRKKRCSEGKKKSTFAHETLLRTRRCHERRTSFSASFQFHSFFCFLSTPVSAPYPE